MSELTGLNSADDCDPMGEQRRQSDEIWKERESLIVGQTRRCLQFWRLQGVDMDTVCVVLGQCAGPDRLVILHTRRTVKMANDSDHAIYGETVLSSISRPAETPNISYLAGKYR